MDKKIKRLSDITKKIIAFARPYQLLFIPYILIMAARIGKK
jgi:hypothetical protein